MAVDMFLDLGDKIKGESKDEKHKDKIDLLAWSWGLSNSGTWGSGGGGGAGKCNIQDISFTKYVDSASCALMTISSNGDHIPTATLTVRKAGKKPLEYIVYKFERVLVTSVSTGGSGGEDRLTENITLNFAKVTMNYQAQQSDGTGKPAGEFIYDIEKNVNA